MCGVTIYLVKLWETPPGLFHIALIVSAPGKHPPHTDYCRLFPDIADPGAGDYR